MKGFVVIFSPDGIAPRKRRPLGRFLQVLKGALKGRSA